MTVIPNYMSPTSLSNYMSRDEWDKSLQMSLRRQPGPEYIRECKAALEAAYNVRQFWARGEDPAPFDQCYDQVTELLGLWEHDPENWKRRDKLYGARNTCAGNIYDLAVKWDRKRRNFVGDQATAWSISESGFSMAAAARISWPMPTMWANKGYGYIPGLSEVYSHALIAIEHGTELVWRRKAEYEARQLHKKLRQTAASG